MLPARGYSLIFSNQSLLQKLSVFLVVKLIFLFGLWWFFIKDSRIATTEKSVEAHLITSKFHTTEQGSP